MYYALTLESPVWNVLISVDRDGYNTNPFLEINMMTARSPKIGKSSPFEILNEDSKRVAPKNHHLGLNLAFQFLFARIGNDTWVHFSSL